MNQDYTKTKRVIDSGIRNKSIKDWPQQRVEFVLANLVEYYSSLRHSDEQLEPLSNYYLENFKSGVRRGKVEFALALRRLKQGRKKEGEKLLNEIISNQKTKDYLKELAKSELAMIKIKDKTI